MMTADRATLRLAPATGPAELRRAFGCFPSGVAAVCAEVGGILTGMAISSFTSVSLDPPLVSFCIAHTSSTWPVLRVAPRLGVSILSSQHERAGRQLAGRHPDRFTDLPWRATELGAVLLEGAGGWFETNVEQEVRAGDHDIVVLRVRDLDADDQISPLVFHASEFRRLER
jgi:flavin reductase (DIM6/NTAB) family NADH-FMN oxidoreductase RutF